MNRKHFAVLLVALGVFWSLTLYGALRYGWAIAGQWAVMMVVAAILVGAIWIKIEEDQVKLDYEEQLREAEGYVDYDEYEQPEPPRAA